MRDSKATEFDMNKDFMNLNRELIIDNDSRKNVAINILNQELQHANNEQK